MDSRNVWIGAICVGLGIAVIGWSSRLAAMPAGFPTAVAILMIILGAAALAKPVYLIATSADVRADLRQKASSINWRRESRIVVPLIVAIIYARFFKTLGFLLLTPPLIIAVAWYLGYRKAWLLIIVGIGATAILYMLFGYFLNVPLPKTPFLGI